MREEKKETNYNVLYPPCTILYEVTRNVIIFVPYNAILYYPTNPSEIFSLIFFMINIIVSLDMFIAFYVVCFTLVDIEAYILTNFCKRSHHYVLQQIRLLN